MRAHPRPLIDVCTAMPDLRTQRGKCPPLEVVRLPQHGGRVPSLRCPTGPGPHWYCIGELNGPDLSATESRMIFGSTEGCSVLSFLDECHQFLVPANVAPGFNRGFGRVFATFFAIVAWLPVRYGEMPGL
jgi:hypothetical protein